MKQTHRRPQPQSDDRSESPQGLLSALAQLDLAAKFCGCGRGGDRHGVVAAVADGLDEALGLKGLTEHRGHAGGHAHAGRSDLRIGLDRPLDGRGTTGTMHPRNFELHFLHRRLLSGCFNGSSRHRAILGRRIRTTRRGRRDGFYIRTCLAASSRRYLCSQSYES